jgi:phosphatidylethanolamine-binding protein (PEBP) family uncharacterized protein
MPIQPVPQPIFCILMGLPLSSVASSLLAVTPSQTPIGSVVTLWVDDSVPAGGTLLFDGGDAWTWLSTNPAPDSGSQAHQSAIAAGEHQHYFQDATNTLKIDAGDKLIVSVYLDPANPPSEIMLQWNDGNFEHRAYWGADKLTAWGTNGTNSRRYMGVLPALGKWVRLEVPAAQVGLVGSTLNGMTFTLFDGRATWDRAGKVSGPITNTPQPTQTPNYGNIFWIDDGVPTGSTLSADGSDWWNWVASNPAPDSGLRAHQSSMQTGEHQHFFYGATDTLPIVSGDRLIASVYLDPINPPSEIMLQWNNGSWEHRAYWGGNHIAWGTNGTESRRYIGPLPPTGQWVRLEIPASLVGIEGSSVNGMGFAIFNGSVTWDRIGKTWGTPPTSTPTRTKAPTKTWTPGGPTITPSRTPRPPTATLDPTLLGLTSICSPDPSSYRVWKVSNPNATAKAFNWRVYPSAARQSGSGVVVAGSVGTPGETFFSTVTESSSDPVQIFVNGILQSSKVSSSTQCAPPTATPTPGTPTFVPPSATPVFNKLTVAAICSYNPSSYRSWRVTNPNPYGVTYTWTYTSSSGSRSGTGTILSAGSSVSGISIFSATTLADPGTMTIFVNGNMQASVTSMIAACPTAIP